MWRLNVKLFMVEKEKTQITPDMRTDEQTEFFTSENLIPNSAKTFSSPSGRYSLVISQYTTKPGCFHHSRGEVSLAGDPLLITTIYRNYGSFPFLFIEGHQNGHDYLVAGEDYQGQTVIELDTGLRRDFLPEEAAKGHGFCWSRYQYEISNQILTVDGCIWACPYEFRFYDFLDPMNGWPELSADPPRYVEAGHEWPVFNSDGTIVCSEFRRDDDASTDDEYIHILTSRETFRRNGMKLDFLGRWETEEEKQRVIDWKANRKLYEEKQARFKASDPLYLAYLELVKSPDLKPGDYESVGVTFENWCPDFKLQEQRWCRRVIYKKDGCPYTADLEWATETGPIKVESFFQGKLCPAKFYEHSVQGMQDAFEYAITLACRTGPVENETVSNVGSST